MMVLVYHLSNGTLLAGGFTGVDIFFVISGYVVTGSLLHDQDGQRPLVSSCCASMLGAARG